MATKKDEPKPVDEETDEEASASEPESGEDARESETSGGETSGDDEASSDGDEPNEAAPLVRTEGESEGEEGGDALAEAEPEGEVAAAQLGTDRWVLAAFFAAGLLGAYVFGRTLQTIWMALANRDWFSQHLATLASVGDDEKGTYAFVVAGIVSLIVVVRSYRRPDVRAWADDVAGELAKVQWPTKKEVQNSTFIVIVASAAATLYLALLDRLWAFVTNIVYGDGS